MKIGNQKGFTLVELMVVLAVVSIISAIFLLNYRQGERNLAIQRSAQIVTQSITRAINNSLGGKEHNGSGGTVSPGGYGIRFELDSDTITVFADCDADSSLDTGSGASSCANAPAEGVPYPEISFQQVLESGVEVSALSPCSGSPCALNILFVPPDPTTVFIPALAALEVQITLRDSEGNQRDIFVNKLGVTRIQ
ncbi:MAG: type II secretion system protein [Candidatus Spechtbacterales bacterium]